MINPAEVEDVMCKLKDLDFTKVMRDKYTNSTPEEKKKHDEIKTRLSLYLKNKDFEGASKYLKHVRSQLT